MSFYLRAILFPILRFPLFFILMLLDQQFEVSPLPDWTWHLTTFVVQMLLVYWFSRWVFASRMFLRWTDIVILACIVNGVHSFLEVLILAWRSDWNWGVFTLEWNAVFAFACVTCVMAFAFWRTHMQRMHQNQLGI